MSWVPALVTCIIKRKIPGLKYLKIEKYFQYFEFSKSTSWDDIIPDQYGGMTESGLYAQWPAYSFKTWYEGMTR